MSENSGRGDFVLVIYGRVGEVIRSDQVTAPVFLKAYDPDFTPPAPDPPYPNGRVEFTDDVGQAMRFRSWGEGIETWQRQSTTIPLRPTDGRPNRPLTAYTCECVKADSVRTV